MKRPKPIVLAILDGWGVAPDEKGNAITRAETSQFDRLVSEYPTMNLKASDKEVGLLHGESGNTQAGHLNIGAGRVYYDMLPKIDESIKSGSIFEKQTFADCFKHAKENNSNVHLVGLLSYAKNHSKIDHCLAIIELAKYYKVKKVFVHLVLDGIDVSSDTGLELLKEFKGSLKKIGVGKIASVSGRNYAMDQNFHWEKTEKAYRTIAEGHSEEICKDPIKAVEESYEKGIYDDWFVPVVIANRSGDVVKVEDNDSLIFFNFRRDGLRQLVKSFVLPGVKFKTKRYKNLFCLTMSNYEKLIPVVPAYRPLVVHNSLTEVLSKAGLKQFHISDSHRYSEINYYFNGRIEKPFPDEVREVIKTPDCFDCSDIPGLSIEKITRRIMDVLYKDTYDFIVVNYSNMSVVAQSGDINSTIGACEELDRQLGKLTDHVLAKGGLVFLVGSYGKAEEMIDQKTEIAKKTNTTNPVPFILVGEEFRGKAAPGGDVLEGDLSLSKTVGSLQDVAPTILKVLDLEQPDKMTGRPLI